MGSYTRFQFKAKLLPSTPLIIDEVINRFDRIADFLEYEVIMSQNNKANLVSKTNTHPFWNTSRWDMLFHSSNWDSSIKPSTFNVKDRILFIDSEFKDYDNEIEKFIDYITPYIQKRRNKLYVGYYKVEDYHRINLYVNTNYGSQRKVKTKIISNNG